MSSDGLRSENESPFDDEIVAEVRAIRRELGAAVGFDLDRMYEQLKAVEADEPSEGAHNPGPVTPIRSLKGQSSWQRESAFRRMCSRAWFQ